MQGIIGKVWDCIPHPAPNNHSTEICEPLWSDCRLFAVGLSASCSCPMYSGVLAFLVRFCHGGTSLGSHSALQPIIQLSKNMSFH